VLIVVASGGYLAIRHGGAGGSATGTRADAPAHISSVQLVPQEAPSGSSATPSAPAATPSRTAGTPKPATRTTPPASSSVVNELLAQINDLRAQHGLPPYSLLSGLNASAHKHNLRMISGCGLSHQCSGEAGLGDRISAEGVKWSSCGENIGWSGPHPDTAAQLVKAAKILTTSMYNETPPDDGHRRNLLSTSFHHVGIDVIRDSSGKVWLTQDFSS
jgi:uncharacterized protein YkwD